MSDISQQDFQSRMDVLLEAVRVCTIAGLDATPVQAMPIEYFQVTIDTLDAMGVRYLCLKGKDGKSFRVTGLCAGVLK